MRTLREILEAELVANPDDLVTHMAYADLLQEEGDPRGEFIQVQLMLEQPRLKRGQRTALRRRMNSLLAEHEPEWLGDLAPYLLHRPHSRAKSFLFARGWLDTLHLENLDLDMARAATRTPQLRLLQVLRIDRVMMEGPGQYAHADPRNQLQLPALAELFAAPVWDNLRRLELFAPPNTLEPRDLAPVLNSPHLPRLTSLRLCLHYMSDRHCETLATSLLFRQLRELDLRQCSLTDCSAGCLVEWGITHLTYLNVDGNNFSEEGVAGLRATGVPLEVGYQGDPEEVPY